MTPTGEYLMTWRVYLSGEIHTDWRNEITSAVAAKGLDVLFAAPVTDHAASDDCGVTIMGAEPNKFWHDHKRCEAKRNPHPPAD
jgi:YtoQ family protein